MEAWGWSACRCSGCKRAAWRQQAGLLALVCLLGGTANVCFVNALVYGEVVRTMLLFYLAPMWSVLGGRVFLGERITGGPGRPPCVCR